MTERRALYRPYVVVFVLSYSSYWHWPEIKTGFRRTYTTYTTYKILATSRAKGASTAYLRCPFQFLAPFGEEKLIQ